MSDPRPPATLEQQADLIMYLIKQCQIKGQVCESTMITIDRWLVDDLASLELRLRRMARHEPQIKRIVTGK